MSEKENLKIISTVTATFSNWNGDHYSNDILRTAIDTLARIGGKLKGTHFINDSIGRHEKDCRLNRLLQIEPNPLMSAYDFLYKVTTHYFLHNNSFIFLDKDQTGNITGFYPIDYTSVTILENNNKGYYLQFRLIDGTEIIFKYSDVIHLKRHYNSDLFLGNNNDPITTAVRLAERQNEGLIHQIENGATIRGLVNIEQQLAPQKIKEYQEAFKENYLKTNNDGGVIVTDTTMNFSPLNLTPANIDKDQLNTVRDVIYSYFGLNNAIVTGDYTEDQWNAFYENTIEPYSIQLSQEFTRKVFTDRERTFGNQILFNTDNMLVANTRNKVTMVKVLAQLGIFRKNEIRELFNLDLIEGEEGNKFIQSLNNINSDLADEYQLNKSEL